MIGLEFEDRLLVVTSAPNRADIACFVGFVRPRKGQPVAAPVFRWLYEQGWASPPYDRLRKRVEEVRAEDLVDVPVPIDDWEIFHDHFDWERRAPGPSPGSTYLGAAVRSFFAQGGRKCYVVPAGDPWDLNTGRGERLKRVPELLPGYPNSLTVSPADRLGWHGVGHLFGLPDVSFLCLPDLADALGAESELPLPPEDPPPPVEQFVDCSTAEPPSVEKPLVPLARAPRCDPAAYRDWVNAVWLIANLFRRYQREVQLVAALPMPMPGSAPEHDLLRVLCDPEFAPRLDPDPQGRGLASAFVQLAYPWVRTPGSAALPEQLESPDAVLAGVLGRNALLRGAFRSAGNLSLGDVYDVVPVLRRDEMLRLRQQNAGVYSLLDRVSLLGPTPAGLRLLSDVTTSINEAYRPACVNRLVSVLLRAARGLGEELMFEPSGERVWAQMRERLETLLLGLLQAGALRGETTDEAFQVRCDRSTMSQNDIDNGRVIAHVQFEAAAPIERITVVLALAGGKVSLLSTAAARREVA